MRGINKSRSSSAANARARSNKTLFRESRGSRSIPAVLCHPGSQPSRGAQVRTAVAMKPQLFSHGPRTPLIVYGAGCARHRKPIAVASGAAQGSRGKAARPDREIYALSSIKEAVAHALRGGKILLDVAGSSK